jgi:hypothetical protein
MAQRYALLQRFTGNIGRETSIFLVESANRSWDIAVVYVSRYRRPKTKDPAFVDLFRSRSVGQSVLRTKSLLRCRATHSGTAAHRCSKFDEITCADFFKQVSLQLAY